MSITKLHSSIPGYWEKSADGTWTKTNYLIKPNNDWADDLQKDNQELISSQNNLSLEEFSNSYYARYPDYYPYCDTESDTESVESSISETSNSSFSDDPGKSKIKFISDIDYNIIEERYQNLFSKNISAFQQKYNIMELEMENLMGRVDENKDIIQKQTEHIYTLEKELTKLEQYGRRENIEIIGIPSKITQQKLETEVLKILKKIGLQHLSHYDIVGCHRVGQKDNNGIRNTIVRFLHRKDTINCLKLKKNLHLCNSMGYSNLTIIENLCPVNKSIFENLSELKKTGNVNEVWTFNGIANYKLTADKNEKPKKVYHKYDMENLCNNLIM